MIIGRPTQALLLSILLPTLGASAGEVRQDSEDLPPGVTELDLTRVLELYHLTDVERARIVASGEVVDILPVSEE